MKIVLYKSHKGVLKEDGTYTWDWYSDPNLRIFPQNEATIRFAETHGGLLMHFDNEYGIKICYYNDTGWTDGWSG